MNSEAIRSLQLDPEAIARASAFYSAYAATCRREWQEARKSPTEPEAGARASSADHRLMELASALRQAGSWKLLIDVTEGLRLLHAAAATFLRLHFGYGTFLGAVTDGALGHEPQDGPDWRGELDMLLTSTVQLQSGEHSAGEVPEAIRHPQQQVYAALAATFGGPGSADLATVIAERTDQRNGVVPVGALGTPIRRLWAVARGLLFDDIETTIAHVSAISERFADRAESAMVNPVLWRQCHTEFEAVDLDIVGLAALSFRRFGRQRTIGAFEQQRAFEGGIARSQILIAHEVDELSGL